MYVLNQEANLLTRTGVDKEFVSYDNKGNSAKNRMKCAVQT